MYYSSGGHGAKRRGTPSSPVYLKNYWQAYLRLYNSISVHHLTPHWERLAAVSSHRLYLSQNKKIYINGWLTVIIVKKSHPIRNWCQKLLFLYILFVFYLLYDIINYTIWVFTLWYVSIVSTKLIVWVISRLGSEPYCISGCIISHGLELSTNC